MEYHKVCSRLVTLLIVGSLFVVTACSSQSHGVVTATPSATLPAIPFTAGHQSPDPVAQYARLYVDTMTLDAKIGQLLYVQSNSNGIYQYPTSAITQKFQPGGLIVYQSELQNTSQAQSYFQHIQADSHIPVLIGTDDEGGAEWRLDNIYPGAPPSAADIGATNDPQVAYNQGAKVADLTKSVGMNVDLAPVADVHPGGQVRDFGTTPDQVTKMAGAWMRGLQDHGVIATLKHFPGLGGTYSDPHAGLPVINHTRDEIEKQDLAPFRNLINSNDPPGMIMSTDILMTAVDAVNPAEVSQPIMTGMLRDELHYDGVVMTDALYMGGMGQYMCNIDHVSPCDPLTYAKVNSAVLGRLGVMAIQAGNDMILGTFNVENTQVMVDSIKNAITKGTLTQARIDQSVRRIITLKMHHGLIPVQVPQPQPGVLASIGALTVAITDRRS